MSFDSSDPKASLPSRGPDLDPGDQVGEYVIEAKIGEGGFGSVFRAHHPLIGKLVAIKVLAPRLSADPEMVSRFIAEARAVNQIRHRNIIDIFGFGQLPDGRHYYVMEHLDGHPLDEVLDARGRLPVEEAVPILRGIARALDAAHQAGIAHRDLKPENVFLVDEDDGMRPVLLDFGIAKLLTADQPQTHKTATGAPIGTPYYMSPEQCRGRRVDHRTDIYALGVVAFRMITGELPFDGEDYMEILLKQIGHEPPPPSTLIAGLPEGIDGVLAWTLAKDPAARPETLSAAVDALEAAAEAAGIHISGGQRTATPMPAVPSMPSSRSIASRIASAPTVGAPFSDLDQPPQTSRAKLAIAAAVILVAAVGLGWWKLSRESGGSQSVPAVMAVDAGVPAAADAHPATAADAPADAAAIPADAAPASTAPTATPPRHPRPHRRHHKRDDRNSVENPFD
ncbi:MAG TPA: serine/threonine-protein kinase [Kofleriaceae bacterium]|nr:serine/threonine-protein kinase [Kofleriaceae bacterium]